MYVYVCAYIYVYVFMYMYMYMHMYMYMYMYMYRVWDQLDQQRSSSPGPQCRARRGHTADFNHGGFVPLLAQEAARKAR